MTLWPRSRITDLEEGSCHRTENRLPWLQGRDGINKLSYTHTHTHTHTHTLGYAHILGKRVKSVKSIIIIISSSSYFKSSLDVKMVTVLRRFCQTNILKCL